MSTDSLSVFICKKSNRKIKAKTKKKPCFAMQPVQSQISCFAACCCCFSAPHKLSRDNDKVSVVLTFWFKNSILLLPNPILTRTFCYSCNRCFKAAKSSYLFYDLNSVLLLLGKLLFFLFLDGKCELLKAFIISSLAKRAKLAC